MLCNQFKSLIYFLIDIEYFEEAVKGFKNATENFTSKVIRNSDINKYNVNS